MRGLPRLALGLGCLLTCEAAQAQGPTRWALVREGDRTVISVVMPRDAAGVVDAVMPVPASLTAKDVSVIHVDAFTRFERRADPSLALMQEHDPCAPPEPPAPSPFSYFEQRPAPPREAPAPALPQGGERRAPAGARLLSRFDVGPYQLEELQAGDGASLSAWLAAHGHRLFDGASDALDRHAREGKKFLAIHLDPSRDGADRLVLRLAFRQDEPRLPMLLWAGTPVDEQIVTIFARRRLEAAEHPALVVPTNLSLAPETLDSFGVFYRAMLDSLEKGRPGAVVTEHAYRREQGSMNVEDLHSLSSLFAREIEGSEGHDFVAQRSLLREGKVAVSGRLAVDDARRAVRQHFGPLRLCYEEALDAAPGLRGGARLRLDIDDEGAVRRVVGSLLPEREALACMQRALGAISLPPPGKGGARIDYELLVEPGPDARPIPREVARRDRISSLFVQTRLRTRLNAASTGELRLREAEPLEGGDEKNAIDQGGRLGYSDRFRASYAVRLRWPGPVACASPVFGVWSAAGEPRRLDAPVPLPPTGRPFESFLATPGEPRAARREPLVPEKPAPFGPACGAALAPVRGSGGALVVAAALLLRRLRGGRRG